MTYDVAVNKAWEALVAFNPQKNISVRFLADEFNVDTQAKKVISLSCNVPAKDFLAVLILHYLVCKLKGLPQLQGVWLPFREIAGIEGYYPAFRKRAIEPIIRKYGRNPEAIFAALERFPAKKAEGAETGIIVEAFAGVPLLIKLWAADEEFGPEANIFFDQSVKGIFCTEDIVVLAGVVAGQL